MDSPKTECRETMLIAMGGSGAKSTSPETFLPLDIRTLIALDCDQPAKIQRRGTKQKRDQIDAVLPVSKNNYTFSRITLNKKDIGPRTRSCTRAGRRLIAPGGSTVA